MPRIKHLLRNALKSIFCRFLDVNIYRAFFAIFLIWGIPLYDDSTVLTGKVITAQMHHVLVPEISKIINLHLNGAIRFIYSFYIDIDVIYDAAISDISKIPKIVKHERLLAYCDLHIGQGKYLSDVPIDPRVVLRIYCIPVFCEAD